MSDNLYYNKDAKINLHYKPSEKEQEARKWVYQRYHDMKNAPERLKAEREWEYGEKAWEAFRHERDADEWQSNYYIPLTTSVVESILAEFVDQRLRPLILPNTPDDESTARVMGHLYDFTWRTADGDLELYDVLKSALIRGTGFAQEYYLKDRRMVKDIIDFNRIKTKKQKTKTEFVSEEREVFEFDGCMMESVSPWDLFWDEKAREFNRGPYKARDAIRRYIMPLESAKRFFSGPIWDPLNNMRFVKCGGDTNYYQFYKPPEGADKSRDVEILWYWARSPEDCLKIVINDVVIKDSPNIFKHKQLPFAKAIDVKRLDQFCGKGEPQLLESVQEELNTLRRMSIDRHHLDIDKTFLVGQTTMIDDVDLIARPHQMIPVDDPSKVKALEYGDISYSVERTQKAITEDSIRATGVDDRFQSLSKTPATATEAAILKESTLKRIRMKIMLLTDGFLRDVARQRVANIMQFYSVPVLEKIVGKEGSNELKLAIQSAMRDDTLEIKNGKPYQKKFRNIRTEGKELTFNERGKVIERDVDGYSFFEARPEFFMPVAVGGFDIRFEAGSTLPISKPLMQSKANEMWDRLVPVAEAAQLSLPKMANWLIKTHDYSPSDFKEVQQVEDQEIQENRQQMQIDLATRENEELLNGQPIPENGTPFAAPFHTELHMALLESEQGRSLPEEQYRKLVKHVTGETTAQQMRAGGGGMPGMEGAVDPNNPQSGPGGNMSMTDVQPGMNRGGPDSPSVSVGPARTY